MRILFFGDDLWASRSLERLVNDGHTVCAVVVRSQPSNDALARAAERLGLPVLQPDEVNAPAFVTRVESFAPDLIVSVSYNQIFGARLLRVAANGGLNVHNGMLPNYRGGGGLYGAVINGESSFGQTVHVIAEGVDAGPILLQREIPIQPDDTMAELIGRATTLMPDTMSEAVTLFAAGSPTLRQQPAEGSYFPKKPAGDELIDWSEPSSLLLARIRARKPGPGNVTLLGRQRITVWKASATTYSPYIGPVGQVIGRRPDGVIVKTGDSAIAVQEVQIEDAAPIVPRFRIGTTFLSNWRQAFVELRSEVDQLSARVRELEQQSVTRVNNVPETLT